MMGENIERALGNVEGRLSGVENQLATLTATLIAKDAKEEKRDAENSARMGTLERKLYWLSGAAAVVGVVITRVDLSKLFAITEAAAHVLH